MFTVSQQQNQYLTYILNDGQAASHLEIVPERGGIVTRWQIQDQDILYFDEKRFADPTLSVRGGIPILFPICGNITDNHYTHNGRSYSLKQHGFARDLPWQVMQQSTENCASLTLSLNSNEQTLAVYPFDFQLLFTYQLQENRLKIYQRFLNLSSEQMPFSVGLHPYFRVQDKTQLSFDILATQYQNQITQEFVRYYGDFDWNLEEIDVAFTPITRHVTSLSDRQRNLQISISYSDLYSTLVFWTVRGKDYVCLEPWSAPRNAINTQEQLTYLEPESSCEAVVEIRVN